MSQARHTSLSLRSQLTGLAGALTSCNPSDGGSTLRLVQQLSALRTQIERDQVDELLPICALALKLAELLNAEGHVSGRKALDVIDGVVGQLCTSLGVERPVAETPAPPPPATPEIANAERALKRTNAPAAKQPSLRTTRTTQPGLKLVSNKKLGEIMNQLSMLTPTQVEQALAHQRMSGCRFGEALIQMKLLSREAVESALRMQNVSKLRSLDDWGGGR